MNISFFKRFISVIALLFCFNTILFSQQPDKEAVVKTDIVKYIDGKSYYMHEVKKGHTLYSISKVYSIPLEDIVFENPGSKESIGIGQILKIPVTSREEKISRSITKKNFDYFFHVATKGETYYKISKIYSVSIGDIEYANPEIRPPLREGEYIKIPVSMQNLDENKKTKTSKDIFEPKKTKPKVESKTQKKNVKPVKPKKQEQNYFKHIVKAKQTLFSISRIYEVTVNDLLTANEGLTTDLNIGQVILIPKSAKAGSSAIKKSNQKTNNDDKNYIIHTVGRYETLYGIALKYKLSIEKIKSLNPGLDHGITPGQKIRIPQKKNRKNYIFHKVDRRRASLRRLSRKYDIEREKIEDINPGIGRAAHEGDYVRIPVEPDLLIKSKKITIPDTIQIKDIIVKKDSVNYDSINCYANIQNAKNKYNVALMLPLYLNEIDSLDIGDHDFINKINDLPSFHFIQMYEGVMMAIDSLKKKGLNLNLHVYDVDKNITKTIKVLQDSALPNMDLIIGPLYNESFKLASNFASLFKIKIINPFTRRNEIISDNSYVFKIQPSVKEQVNQIKTYISGNFSDSRIFLLRHNQYKDSIVFTEFSDTLNKIIIDSINVSRFYLNNLLTECSVRDTSLAEGEIMDSIAFEGNLYFKDTLGLSEDTITFSNSIIEVVYTRDSIYKIIDNASVKRKNIIIAFSEDKAFVTDILSKLNVLRDTFDIQLIGLPQWSALRGLDSEKLGNLNFHTFSSTYIDYDDERVINFIKTFRKKYKTEPQSFAFSGFDISWYFINALMKFGNDFEQCLPYYHPDLIQTNFYFEKQHDNNGFENIFWNIQKIVNYELQKVDNVVFKN